MCVCVYVLTSLCNFTTFYLKKQHSNNNYYTLNFKSECPLRDKKAINNLISCARLISSSKTIFYKEVEKQNILSSIMGFLTTLLMNKLNVWLKMLTNKNKHCTNPPSQQTFINLFYCNQMHYNYKLDEKYQKHWFKETYSPLILIKK